MRKTKARPISQSTTGASTHSRAGAHFTELLFEIFRVYSRINAAGDILSAGTGLTSARWRVLGSVLPLPKSVAQVARERGLTRQSVQQIANSLVRDGFAKFQDNERHKSSKLLTPTGKGRSVVLAMNQRSIAWVNKVGAKVPLADLKTTLEVLTRLREHLEKDGVDIS